MKKTETKSTVLLQHHLKALKLPTIQRECEKVAARCATENVDHLAFLLQLCELELIDRERRASERRLKAAKFPTYKTLDTFDFKAQPSLNKVLITELMLGEYIDKRENILLVGGHRRAALVAEQGKLTLPSHWQSLPVAEADAFAFIESRN
jgi:DNA replication protein DnaC